ncbi:zinc transporter ZIP9 [Anopheles ziemanni]|uniref:zinc transporter ZIP9 n=1 Tax=Anopheles coustani TaxID=139045 RepID=UPI00265903A1|nr:zinc transporter ZIP9 [Anopheles coustani]XP_058172908.1 zinc transporter ZIP9 [Anopheles ziemanni]
MDEVTMLLALVIVMLVGSYLAGNIPLIMSLSEEKLKNVSIFGAGLLVGTALTVIIPEGIRSLYDERSLEQAAKGHGTASGLSVEEHKHEHSNDEHSGTIGLSLVLGFVFMMLVDQVSSRRTEGSNERNLTATIGLVVHAAADGVALGAAATTSHSDVEIIVFLAIMLHKAPAAFGLVSFLLHEGVERDRIRKHLLIFALAAPALTLLTYFGIGSEQKETLESLNATGIAMLFSAGTFLYVATVHVLPELTHRSGHGHGHSHAIHHGNYSLLEQQPPLPVVSGKPSSPGGPGGLRNYELGLLILGALAPLFLTLGHHH